MLKIQHCLELRLMFDVDVQGTLKITMIYRAESRGNGQWGMQVDVF